MEHCVCSYATHLKAKHCWKVVRKYIKARWIACFWHELTSRHMAVDGTYYTNDVQAYESEFV